MRFKQLEKTIDWCKNRLESSASPELETYLVSYLLVVTYAELEGAIQRIIHARVGRLSDSHVHSLVRSYLQNKSGESRFGRIGTSELGTWLARFGGPCKTKFVAEISGQVPGQAWDLIVQNRHNVAHVGIPLQMTFREFTDAYRHTHVVLDAFARACGLKKNELDDL